LYLEFAPGDTDFALRWRLIKTWFTKHCEPELHGVCDKSRRGRGKQAVWQHRYWEHAIRDEIDFQHHVDYIHYNPVKHGLAASPKDWLYSSFHQFVEAGFYSEDWGADWVELIDIGKE
jgi:putative transposase